ncbi:MAG: META domain-containing protein [Rhodobacteraceae bacterium]|nr:META domain-containing protein [Paracoccaceae bacterium]
MAEARQITGDLAYRERIALEPGAEIVVELRDETGALVAEFRADAGDRQVPLPFALAAPEGALTLRGGLLVGGVPVWASEPVAVPAGSGDAALGTVGLRRVVPMGFATTFRCGEAEVEVGILGRGARLRIGGTYVDLAPAIGASGARFEAPDDPGTWAWSKGNAMTVSFRGAELPPCLAALERNLAAFLAHGTEPFWTLRVENGEATFGPMDGAPVSGPVGAPEIVDGARRYAVGGTGLAFTVADAIARDAMTGMPYPATVTVATAEGTLSGAGGDPEALLRGVVWRAEDLGGRGIPDGAEVTLVFRDGRASGRSGCNRYTGGYGVSGEGLSFGQMAATRMACPEALMTLERDYLAALSRVSRFDIDATGALVLIAGDQPVVLLRH